jgi:hypothetical protein
MWDVVWDDDKISKCSLEFLLAAAYERRNNEEDFMSYYIIDCKL